MKKRIIMIMAAVLMFVFVGCGQKEQVDEEDMSRWVIEFSSEYTNDMENGHAEMTVEELKERNYENNFTITFQYYKEYGEIGNIDFEFILLPEMKLYYVNDAGERIENGELNDDKYYLVCESKEKYDADEDRFEQVGRVVMPGEYRIEYALKRNDTQILGDRKNYLTTFYINIFIGNLT